MPTSQPGRSDLLASIQGKGVHSLRKTDPNGTPARKSSPPLNDSGGATASSPTAPAGNDLTSALAAALLERNKKLGDSESEDEDEDDWD